MLPIFQDKARELSVAFDGAIEREDKGVVEGKTRMISQIYKRTLT
jgi:hypothetical protein